MAILLKFSTQTGSSLITSLSSRGVHESRHGPCNVPGLTVPKSESKMIKNLLSTIFYISTFYIFLPQDSFPPFAAPGGSGAVESGFHPCEGVDPRILRNIFPRSQTICNGHWAGTSSGRCRALPCTAHSSFSMCRVRVT